MRLDDDFRRRDLRILRDRQANHANQSDEDGQNCDNNGDDWPPNEEG